MTCVSELVQETKEVHSLFIIFMLSKGGSI